MLLKSQQKPAIAEIFFVYDSDKKGCYIIWFVVLILNFVFDHCYFKYTCCFIHGIVNNI